MGFRTGAYAKVWEIENTDYGPRAKITVSRKNKQTGEYVQDFSGFVSFSGPTASEAAKKLKAGDRIKLGDVDVSTKYNEQKKITYTNYKVFGFESADGTNVKSGTGKSKPVDSPTEGGSGDDGCTPENLLPF